MDRDSVTKATSQIGFIKFVLIPLFESLAKVRETRIAADAKSGTEGKFEGYF